MVKQNDGYADETVQSSFRMSRRSLAEMRYILKEKYPTSSTAIVIDAIHSKFIALRKKNNLGELTDAEIKTLNGEKKSQ